MTMTNLSPVSAAVGKLHATFAGRLLQSVDAGYDEARKVHNGLIDKRPALIAQCRGLADIVDAIQLARTQKLDVAVRGGGHNVAGRAPLSLVPSLLWGRDARRAGHVMLAGHLPPRVKRLANEVIGLDQDRGRDRKAEALGSL
jgi:hypothetical protein